MKKNFVVPALVLGMAAMVHAQTPTKVAIIHVQNAILQTKDGQKAAGELQSRFAPKKAELDKKQADIASLQDQLRKGSATMSEDAKAKLMRDIDANNKSLQRDTEDAQADLDAEQGKIMQELGNKVMAVIEKCYEELAKDCHRISCTVKMDWRKGQTGRLEAKVASVERHLGRELKK